MIWDNLFSAILFLACWIPNAEYKKPIYCSLEEGGELLVMQNACVGKRIKIRGPGQRADMEPVIDKNRGVIGTM